MSESEVRIEGQAVEPADGWRLSWTDRRRGTAVLVSGERSTPLVVEGGPSEWMVTIRGRRIPVEVRTWRERIRAEAETAAQGPSGALAVRATLPGLVVAVRVAEGDEVEEGDPLLTIEAMKMQNEVRAPRAARVARVAVAAGQVVATGTELLTLE